ncbi:MAG: hypothetical protein AAFX03_12615 [Pseudomonadota bacterium]
MRRLAIAAALLALAACGGGPETYEWVDWSDADEKTAEGRASGVRVAFLGDLNAATNTSGEGENFFAAVPETFSHPDIGAGPPDAEILRMFGGNETGRQALNFSRPVEAPVFAILSLGGDRTARIVFETEVELLQTGPGYWGGSEGTLVLEDDNKTLVGDEGYGLVRVPGEHTEIGFATPNFESDYGFQLAIK